MGSDETSEGSMSKRLIPTAATPDSLLTLNNRVTIGFVAATVVALSGRDTVFAVLCAVMFFAGAALFLLGFWNAVQRSRQEIVNLPVLLGFDAESIAPLRRRTLWVPLVVAVVVSLGGAALRPFTQQAFGILGPLFQLGVMVLWTSRHARFETRD